MMEGKNLQPYSLSAENRYDGQGTARGEKHQDLHSRAEVQHSTHQRVDDSDVSGNLEGVTSYEFDENQFQDFFQEVFEPVELALKNTYEGLITMEQNECGLLKEGHDKMEEVKALNRLYQSKRENFLRDTVAVTSTHK